MITIKKLDSGFYHIKGDGVCNWAQPPYWPCDEHILRAHAFPQASEGFIQECVLAAINSGSKPKR